MKMCTTRHLLADLKLSFGNKFVGKFLFPIANWWDVFWGRMEMQGEGREE